jgi:3-hydroxybutyryl-CoA dehydrogenase
MTELRSIAVIGAGTMGHGIAECCAIAGLTVSLMDVDDRLVDQGLSKIKTSLARFVKAGKLTEEDAASAVTRIRPTTDLEAAVDGVEIVVEAVPEILDLKRQVFRRLVAATTAGTVLATNTTQFTVTSIAAATERPEDVIVAHFFNPPVLMKLVEIVRGSRTSDHCVNVTLELTRRLGKEAALCKRDTVGFITSRAASALRLECIRIYEEGIASIEDIDRAMRLGFNHPMGPFELNDYNGLDVSLQSAEGLREAYGDRFAPPQSLVARVKAGMLGRKTGAGWYDYANDKAKVST